MKPLKGSRTEANLMAAFAGEHTGKNEVHVLCFSGKKRRLCADFKDF